MGLFVGNIKLLEPRSSLSNQHIVRFEDLEFPPRLVFNQSLKDFEEAKNFKLMLQEVNPTVLGKVIYECQCIFYPTH